MNEFNTINCNTSLILKEGKELASALEVAQSICVFQVVLYEEMHLTPSTSKFM